MKVVTIDACAFAVVGGVANLALGEGCTARAVRLVVVRAR